MDRRLRTNLVLAAVVALLGLFAWLAPEPRDEPKGHPLLDDENPSRIAVHRKDETHFVLERADDRWQLVEPVSLPADRYQVESLLQTLRQAAAQRYALADVNRAELGLDDPEWRVDVDGTELLLGDSAALGNTRYVQRDGHVYLVSDVLSYRLKRDVLDYASKRLLPEDARVASIRLPDGRHIAREGAGWSIEPEQEDITSDALQSLVDAWQRASAVSISEANSVPRAGEVRIEFEDGRVLHFGVETADDGLKLSRDEPAVTYGLPGHSADELLKIAVADAPQPPGEE